MIQKVEMHTVICDHCKKDIGSESEFSCWNDDNYAEENAMESDWLKQKEKHYCPECYFYDDNDNLVLRPETKNKYDL